MYAAYMSMNLNRIYALLTPYLRTEGNLRTVRERPDVRALVLRHLKAAPERKMGQRLNPS